MSRSIWKGPYIDPYILKLNYEISSTTGTHGDNAGVVANANSKSKPLPTKNANSTSGKNPKETPIMEQKKALKIWSRRSVIIPTFVGLRVFVYNGKKFMPIKIMPEMVGHKFGAFSSTRTFTKKFSNTKK